MTTRQQSFMSWAYKTHHVLMLDGPNGNALSDGDGTSGMEPKQDQKAQKTV